MWQILLLNKVREMFKLFPCLPAECARRILSHCYEDCLWMNYFVFGHLLCFYTRMSILYLCNSYSPWYVTKTWLALFSSVCDSSSNISAYLIILLLVVYTKRIWHYWVFVLTYYFIFVLGNIVIFCFSIPFF